MPFVPTAWAKVRAALLSAVMDRVGATPAAILRLLGAADSRLAPDEQAALWRYRAQGNDSLAVFVSVFVLDQAVPRAKLQAALGAAFARLEHTGLIVANRRSRAPHGARVASDLVRAGLCLSVHDGCPLWSDPDSPTPSRDHVLGVTRATLVLARALPRAVAGHVLELGTGAGHLAITLCAAARSVTATDVAPRALRIGALNAALAGVTNLTLLRSDRFAAVGDRRFDFITGNLPFVIAPDRRFVFRDGGMPEDGFVASVIGGAGRHLRPGAFALFIGQWVHRVGEAEDQRLAPWFVAAGCDALVLRLEAEPADAYAARWSAGPARDLSPAARDDLLRGWADHMRRARIQGVSTGLFVLRRRRAARHYMSIDDPDGAGGDEAATPTWAAITARFAALDREAGITPTSS